MVMAITPQKGAKASLAGPTRSPAVEYCRFPAMQSSIDERRDLSLSHPGDQQDGPRPAKGKALVHPSDARAAGITSQPVSILGEHGCTASGQG